MTDQTWYAFRIARSGPAGKKFGDELMPAEDWAARMMRQLGYQAFTPIEHRTQRRRGKRKGVIARSYPMIPGYLFVGFSGPVNWFDVFSLPWIVGVVGWGDRPRPIPAQGVLHLQTQSDANIPHAQSVITRKSFQIGDAVLIEDGPFTGFESKIQDIRGENATLLVELFGKSTLQDFDLAMLKAA